MMNTDILEEAANESILSDMNTDAFKDREAAGDFNNILDSITKYSNSIFRVPVESIPVHRVSESTYLVDFDDAMRYMATNDIDSIEEAVNDICIENGIHEVTLAIDEEVLNEARKSANKAKSKKKKGEKICAKCHMPATECQCESFVEEMEPEVEAFSGIVDTILYCHEVGIPIALRG